MLAALRRSPRDGIVDYARDIGAVLRHKRGSPLPNQMQEPIRKAVSPDGKLTLELFSTDDYYLGFADQAWHTHGDLLVPKYGEDPERAAHAFFDAVLSDKEIIAVSQRRGRKEEVSIIDDPQTEPRYMEDGEVLTLRLWSGLEISRHEKG